MVVENGAVASAGALVRELVVNDIRTEHEIYIDLYQCKRVSRLEYLLLFLGARDS